jgi:hypothetical protein
MDNDEEKLRVELRQLRALNRWSRHPAGVIGLLNILVACSHHFDLWTLAQIATGAACLLLALSPSR